MITARTIAFGASLLLCALFGLVIAGVIGAEKKFNDTQFGNTNTLLLTNSGKYITIIPRLWTNEVSKLHVRANWHLTTNWLVEPKERLLVGPFPQKQRYFEYGILQSNLVAELVYGGKTQHVTLESTPGMSITRAYKLTVTLEQ